MEIQSHPEYQSAVKSLLVILDSWAAAAVEQIELPSVNFKPTAVLDAVSNHAKIPATPTQYLSQVVEAFSGGPGSLTTLYTSYLSFVKHLQAGDGQFRSVALELKSLLEDALVQPDYVISSAAHRRIASLQSRLRDILDLQPALKEDTQTFLRQAEDLLARLGQDEYLVKLAQHLDQLVDAVESWSLAVSGVARGNISIWRDVIEWLLPRMLELADDLSVPK